MHEQTRRPSTGWTKKTERRVPVSVNASYWWYTLYCNNIYPRLSMHLQPSVFLSPFLHAKTMFFSSCLLPSCAQRFWGNGTGVEAFWGDGSGLCEVWLSCSAPDVCQAQSNTTESVWISELHTFSHLPVATRRLASSSPAFGMTTADLPMTVLNFQSFSDGNQRLAKWRAESQKISVVNTRLNWS